MSEPSATAKASRDAAWSPRVLVVDDDRAVRDLVERVLTEGGYRPQAVASGAAALALAEETDPPFDLAVVDLGLPDVDGLVLVRQFADRLGIPVLVLSGAGEPNQRIEGLEAGADDYLCKPFEPRELTARATAILRARRQAWARPLTAYPQLRVDGHLIDLRRQRVVGPQGEVALSDAESKLLKALLARPNEVLSREEILSITHEEGEATTARSVDIQVTRLRRKIEADPAEPRLVRTVRSAGYMLVADRIEPA